MAIGLQHALSAMAGKHTCTYRGYLFRLRKDSDILEYWHPENLKWHLAAVVDTEWLDNNEWEVNDKLYQIDWGRHERAKNTSD